MLVVLEDVEALRRRLRCTPAFKNLLLPCHWISHSILFLHKRRVFGFVGQIIVGAVIFFSILSLEIHA
jgi:hypothetical protein